MGNFADELCGVELDRLTAAEICIDECLTIMDRHGERGVIHEALRLLSARLDLWLLSASGPVDRRARLIRVRAALTDAFPMTDEDLFASTPDLHGEGSS